MKISIITLFPKMVSSFFEESIIKRAVEKKLTEIEIVDLRKFATDSYGTVDDRPYGGGAGMVLKVDVLHKAIQSVIPNTSLSSRAKSRDPAKHIVLTSARGKVFDQDKAKKFSKLNHLVIIAGHYEGVDERVLDYVDEELSIGDFIMTGGEIAAAAIIDAAVRLIPRVLKKSDATANETFDIGGRKLLEYPHYTRPEVYQGKKVPEVLLGGDHKKIDEWRLKKALELTKKRRPDLLD